MTIRSQKVLYNLMTVGLALVMVALIVLNSAVLIAWFSYGPQCVVKYEVSGIGGSPIDGLYELSEVLEPFLIEHVFRPIIDYLMQVDAS